MRILLTACALMLVLNLTTACSPEVGSDKWCANLKDKPKGEWTANEGKDFLKHCVIN